MIKRIKICRSRNLLIECGNNKVGTVGEHNATVLFFIKPSEINGEPIEHFTMRLVISVGGERYLEEPDGNELALDERYTGSEKLTLVVQFLKNTEVKWTSYPLDLYFVESLPDDKSHRPYMSYLDFKVEDGNLYVRTDGNIRFRINGQNLEVNT